MYCGPKEAKDRKIINDYLAGKPISVKTLDQVLKKFIAAYNYQEVIAKKNGLKPMDTRVIEAYWIGNKLLEKVSRADLQKMIREKFVGPGMLSKEKADRLIKNLPTGAVAHHTFHVFYLGAVTDVIELKGKLLDICRPAWGKIIALKDNGARKDSQLTISYWPIAIKNNQLSISKRTKIIKIIWRKIILPQAKIGQTISFHWHLAGQVLTPDKVRNLRKYTLKNIKAVNKKNEV